MEEKIIKNFKGQIIGYVRISDNGDKTVMNFYRQILGYYFANRDETTDFYRRVIARGDATGMLLQDE